MATLTELKLTKKQRAKKVRLAKDVLEQLGNKYIASPGQYFSTVSGNCYIDEENYSALDAKELQQELKSIEKCDVCLRGALFVAAIERYDSVEGCQFDFNILNSKNEAYNYYSDDSVEDRFFTMKELLELEQFFENSVDGMSKKKQDLISFLSGKARMKIAMQHIVDNNGEISLSNLLEDAFNKAKKKKKKCNKFTLSYGLNGFRLG